MSYIHLYSYEYFIHTLVFFTVCGYITKSQCDQLPVGLSQRSWVWIPFRLEFFSGFLRGPNVRDIYSYTGVLTCVESVDIHVLTGFNKNIIFLTTSSLMWFIFILQLIYQLRRTTDVFNESEFGQIGNLCKSGTDNIQRVRKLSVAKQMLAGLF